MSEIDKQHIRLLQSLGEQHPEELQADLSELKGPDLAELLDSANEIQTASLIALLSPVQLSEAFVEMEEDTVQEVTLLLSKEQILLLLQDMAPDDAVDFLGQIAPTHDSKKLLQKLPDILRKELEELLTFDEESAGGIMTSELTALPSNFTIKEARSAIARAELKDPIMSVYVIEPNTGILLGSVDLIKLISANPFDLLEDHLESDYIWSSVDDDQEDVARDFRKYNLWVMPVVDERHKLVGRITADDILDVAQEEADEDMAQMTGTPDILDADDSIRHIIRLRLPWLLVTMGLALLNCFLIGVMIPADQKGMITIFIPVIMAMSGNTGMQAATIIIRELALGRINNKELYAVSRKETSLGASMGLICGLLATVLAYGIIVFNGGTGDPNISNALLSTLVGLSIFNSMIFSSFISSMIPIILDRLDLDPAVSAGPFVTTLNDIFASVIYFLVSYRLLIILFAG